MTFARNTFSVHPFFDGKASSAGNPVAFLSRPAPERLESERSEARLRAPDPEGSPGPSWPLSF